MINNKAQAAGALGRCGLGQVASMTDNTARIGTADGPWIDIFASGETWWVVGAGGIEIVVTVPWAGSAQCALVGAVCRVCTLAVEQHDKTREHEQDGTQRREKRSARELPPRHPGSDRKDDATGAPGERGERRRGAARGAALAASAGGAVAGRSSLPRVGSGVRTDHGADHRSARRKQLELWDR